MDILFEFIAELILEGSFVLGTNKKVSKWIRYPLLVILLILFSSIIFFIFYIGIKIFKENIYASLLIILLGLILLIGSIIKLIKTIKEDKEKTTY